MTFNCQFSKTERTETFQFIIIQLEDKMLVKLSGTLSVDSIFDRKIKHNIAPSLFLDTMDLKWLL